MTTICKKATTLLAAVSLAISSMAAQGLAPVYEFNVDASRQGAPIQPTMYGIFFEDINFGADGGLYAELVKNRSFEFHNPLSGWTPFGNVTILAKDPCFDKNPRYARLACSGQITGTGLENEGFRGIGVKEGERYSLSLHARSTGNSPVTLRIELVNHANDIFETKKLEINGKSWKKYTVALAPQQTEAKSRLRITMETEGVIEADHISLFPQKTFNNRPNGMRADLAQALKDLHPGVFRFPGGCIVEGTTIETRYQWKNTIGPVENRPVNINRWNYTFPYKKFPDYYQSCGLGFFEYFLLSEDLGAEPLPVLNCGLSCQFENDDMTQHTPLGKMQPFVDDALDLIEFANGPATSAWGSIRAAMGHPEPFHLKYLAIGNEQWGPIYPERLELFVKAIRARYPDIQIVGSSGPGSEGEDFDYLWPEMKRLGVDLVDEHFYRSPEWFLRGAGRYDSYDRNGPKVFAGEYACHAPNRENSFLTALCEAAFMTGFERNADVVRLCTYAPLFSHADAWQWRPDLIWFDNLSLVKTPNYYVQQLYARHAGTNVLPLQMNGAPVAGQDDLYATAALDKETNELIIKIANVSIRHKTVKLHINGLSPGKHSGKLLLLHSPNLEARNTFAAPHSVTPAESPFEAAAPLTHITLKPLSFSVYRIALQPAQEHLSVYSHKVGAFELILLAESQGQGNKSILIGATPEMLRECAPDGTFPNAVNAFLVKTPDRNILIDAGLGKKLFDNLHAVNLTPGQIDIILITHMHGDHIGGLLRDGKVMFPQAELYLPQPEYDYWMSDGKFKQQQDVIAAYKSRLHLFKPGEPGREGAPLLPGFTAYAACGHTPGHTAFLLESGDEKMFVWGDVAHAMALQMPYPQVAVTYDVNPDDAIAARKQVLEYVSRHKIPIAGMHIAFPSMGTVSRRQAGGYLFTPFPGAD